MEWILLVWKLELLKKKLQLIGPSSGEDKFMEL